MRYFHNFIRHNASQNCLVVQPRMGFSHSRMMREGLQQVRQLAIPSIGTITVDSFTRTGDVTSVKEAIAEGRLLNGYPITFYSQAENCRLLEGIRASDFPVQVRHGSPLPEEIFKSTVAAGVDATEGGPVSYCLPYSRVPLKESVNAWIKCSRMYADAGDGYYHIESFGGCMMGQLCPPSMLIAITILEALFFKHYGVKSVSVSLTQGTNPYQDLAALRALNGLASKYLGDDHYWHVVFYTFMGKFPTTFPGAKRLIEESAKIAKEGNAQRLIVKTVSEAHQVPTIRQNEDALLWAHQSANQLTGSLISGNSKGLEQQIFQEADFLIDMVLNLDNPLAKALVKAFTKGCLDIPYCLHPCNKRRAMAQLDDTGRIFWSDYGRIPFPNHLRNHALKHHTLTSGELLEMLSYNQVKYDYCNNVTEDGLSCFTPTQLEYNTNF